MSTLFAEANRQFRTRNFQVALIMYEVLLKVYGETDIYLWSIRYCREKIRLSGQINLLDGLLKESTIDQKLLKIVHITAEQSPVLAHECLQWVTTACCTEKYLALANINRLIGEQLWLADLNRYLNHFNISPLLLRGDSSSTSVFHRLASVHIKPADGPLVTISMSCFNAERFLAASLDSLLNQSYRNIEILVTDDCSTDSTLDIVQKKAASDERIVILKNETNKGPYFSRNRAFARASGKYFTILDADDFALPQRIQLQVECLENSAGLVAVLTDWVRMSNNGKFHFRNAWGGVYQHEAVATMMLRTELVKNKIGYWDSVRFGADTEFMFRLFKVFGADAVKHDKFPSTLALYHPDSLTSNLTTGISNENGLSDVSLRYEKAWLKWHHVADEYLYLSLEQTSRCFDVPHEIIC
jgi:hypothetical protein